MPAMNLAVVRPMYDSNVTATPPIDTGCRNRVLHGETVRAAGRTSRCQLDAYRPMGSPKNRKRCRSGVFVCGVPVVRITRRALASADYDLTLGSRNHGRCHLPDYAGNISRSSATTRFNTKRNPNRTGFISGTCWLRYDHVQNTRLVESDRRLRTREDAKSAVARTSHGPGPRVL